MFKIILAAFTASQVSAVSLWTRMGITKDEWYDELAARVDDPEFVLKAFKNPQGPPGATVDDPEFVLKAFRGDRELAEVDHRDDELAEVDQSDIWDNS